MRCKACDDLLSDREAVQKSPLTGDYYDLCSKCLAIVMEDLYPEKVVMHSADNPFSEDTQ